MPRKAALGVFINCPFDKDYQHFFDAIVFTVFRCGFDARCAREIDDGAGTRIDKIMDLIEKCPYGIHDICRTELDFDSQLPRFNMPLELGLFLGAKRYGRNNQKKKQCLILDREKFRYQKFISDISGQDIHSHDMQVEKLISEIRDFLRSLGPHVSGGQTIHGEYLDFERDKLLICKSLDLAPNKLTFRDLTNVITSWLSRRKSVAP